MPSGEQESLFLRWQSDHIGLILKIVRAYAVSFVDQDDLLQEVLSNLWSSIPRFQGAAKESTWIYRVALNTALAWRRDETRRRQLHLLMIECDVSLNATVDSSMKPSRHELIEKMYVAIRQLSKIDAALALMHLDGLNYHEMSEVLGISENYVGVKLCRIRKELFELLKDDCDEL
ncbi:RNA polymerase sigma factor [Schlesneria paludicola]|uniref:RNA polymerase sigma factor n=1 Tax=Schlesneria paludicola TaxID=360056 RepID=UPI00029A323A|nr:RNA polymerase sigma factor [Schlesneria paludicola]